MGVRKFSGGERPQIFRMGVCKFSAENFPESTFCLSFSGCWRCNANGRTQKQKISSFTATVAYSVFPVRKLYTEQIFALVSMDILTLS